MTVSRKFGKDTAFGAWLRGNRSLDSRKGYVASDLDYLWCNYKKDVYMLIEEKSFSAMPSYSQRKLYERIDRNCQSDSAYRGFHVLVFEATNPRDGRIWLDGRIITKEDLTEFLQFAKPATWYRSYAPTHWPERVNFPQRRTKTDWRKFGCSRR